MPTINPYQNVYMFQPSKMGNFKRNPESPTHRIQAINLFPPDQTRLWEVKVPGCSSALRTIPLQVPVFFWKNAWPLGPGRGDTLTWQHMERIWRWNCCDSNFWCCDQIWSWWLFFFVFCPRKKTTAPKNVLFFSINVLNDSMGCVYSVHWTQAGVVQLESRFSRGLMVGILATVLVQSSSTSTSIVVGLVGAGQLSVHNAPWMSWMSWMNFDEFPSSFGWRANWLILSCAT